jgi:hypothetical protein
MKVAVVTGGRDRLPTLAELVRLIEILIERGATHVREGECKGTDKTVAAWLKARTSLVVEPWRAEDYGEWPYCGHRRNEAMLDGDGQDLFGVFEHPPADFLVAFEGGPGTRHCIDAAKARAIPTVHIEPVAEPRIWNAHHGPAPGPTVKVGRPAPLGNPWPLDLRDGEPRPRSRATRRGCGAGSHPTAATSIGACGRASRRSRLSTTSCARVGRCTATPRSSLRRGDGCRRSARDSREWSRARGVARLDQCPTT